MKNSTSMSSSSKRKMGLEEAGGEGKVGKRVLSDSVSSSSEEEEGNKLLYVFVSHLGAIDYVYSLFALSIPNHGSIVEIETATLNPKMVKGISYPISSITEPKRTRVAPVLRFPANEGWPNVMRCIGLGRKLYFLGGVNKELIPSTQVHVLDLSQQEMEDDPTKALKPVASMDTGKSSLFVSFVADGKIFVVCGKKQCSYTRVPLTRFEIFCPRTGVWNVPDLQPPFPDAYLLYPPIVLDRTVFFAGDISPHEKFTCRYNIDTGIWTDYCRVDYFSDSVRDIVGWGGGGGGEVVGETLWNVCDHPKTEKPVVVRVDLAPLLKIVEEERVPNNKKFFDDVLRYCIPDQLDVWGRGTIEPAVRHLARLSEDSRRPNSSRLCFLQLEPCNGFVGGQTRISAILFDVHGKGAGSAEYVTSAHYFFRNCSQNNYYKLTDAHLV